MKLILQNPYRIAGILSNAKLKDIERQKSKFKAFSRVGKEMKSEFDFPFLGDVTRTKEEIDIAFSAIGQNHDKVRYALFWFLNASAFDNTALDYLKNGDEAKAAEIWEKVTTDKAVNAKNFSAFNNLGTLKLISNKKADQKIGIENKVKLIESKYFKSFVEAVADETLLVENKQQSKIFMSDLLSQLGNQYSISETMELFSDCNEAIQQYVKSKFTEEPLHSIEGQIERCKKKRKEDKGEAYKFGLALFTSTTSDLSLLKSLLGENDLKYKAIADQLANEIMQCGIDYFNENQQSDSSEDYLESALKLTKIADSIAVGKLTKDRAKDSLATLADMKDKELNQAIAVLTFIKDTFDEACRQIDKKVEELQNTPAQYISLGVSIDMSKVLDMKINALDWDKIVELVKKDISRNNVEKISKSESSSKIVIYKSHVDFLLRILRPPQRSKVEYLNYWKNKSTSKTSEVNSSQSKHSISTNTDSGACYIATMAYGDYNDPQVVQLRYFRDNYLSNSQLGSRFIEFYYQYSPMLVEKLRHKRNVNLLIRKCLDLLIKNIIK